MTSSNNEEEQERIRKREEIKKRLGVAPGPYSPPPNDNKALEAITKIQSIDSSSSDKNKFPRPMMPPPKTNPSDISITVDDAKQIRAEIERIKTVLREYESVLKEMVRQLGW